MTQSLMIEEKDEVKLVDATPYKLYEALDKQFHFTADATARTFEDSRAPKFWDDALAARWSGERVFMNPPADMADKFVCKAIWETRQDDPVELVVLIAAADMEVMGMVEIHATSKVLPPMDQMYVIDRNGKPAPAVVAVFQK